MNNIKVSIIMPVYNVEKYLRESLDTAVNQTLKDIEIICVNDGSTDKSLEILIEYKKKYPNIIIINQDNNGLSGARNSGIDIARGEYIYFFDSDDLIDLDLCKVCYDTAQKYDLDILTFDAEVFYDNVDLNNKFKNLSYDRKGVLTEEQVFTGDSFYVYLKEMNVYKSSVCLHFYKKEFLIKNKLYFFVGILHEDELYSTKVILSANKIKYIPRIFFKRRIRANSIMTTKKGYKNSYGYFIVANELYVFYKKKKHFLENDTKQKLLESIFNYYMCAYMIVLDDNDDLSIELKSNILINLDNKKEVRDLKKIKTSLLIKFPKICTNFIKIRNKIKNLG